MALSWPWLFILTVIIYGVFLVLGCGGIVAYNIWNVKNMRKIRRREAEVSSKLFSGEKSSVIIKDSLDDLSLENASWRDSKATTATTVFACSFDAGRGLAQSLEDLSMFSDEDRHDGRRISGVTIRDLSMLSCIGEDEREGGSKRISQTISLCKSEDGGKGRASMRSPQFATDGDVNLQSGGDLAIAIEARPMCPRGPIPRRMSKVRTEQRRSSIYSQDSWNL